jgi:6-phosphogluconolactonase
MSRNLLFTAFASVLLASPSFAQSQPQGAVFSMTNASAGNEIVAFVRGQHGDLTLVGNTPTNGTGNDKALESQGSIAMTKDGAWLLAVNSGSDEITVFSVQGTTLTQTDKVASGGKKPVSLAVGPDSVYVLNAGNGNNITGFTLDAQGKLTPIAGSTQTLSASQTSPSQVGWSPNGQLLLVTEKDTNMVDAITINPATNSPATFTALPAAGRTPFGFAFRGEHHLFSAEANAGVANGGTVTNYGVRQNTLETVQGSLPTGQSSTCWIVTSGAKPFVYVSNTGSNSITGFQVKNGGELDILTHSGLTATTGNAPADLATVRGMRFVYVLDSGDGTVEGFSVANDGSLTSLGPATAGLPTVGASLTGRRPARARRLAGFSDVLCRRVIGARHRGHRSGALS